MTQPPAPFESLAYATPMHTVPSAGVWRERNVLVAPTLIELPPRCVKCNAPQAERYTKNAAWFPRWIIVLIIPGVLIFAIVAMILQKKATYSCGLCKVHASERRKGIAIAWGLLALSVAGFVLAIVVGNDSLGRGARPMTPVFVILGIVGLIVSLVFATTQVPIFSPKKIDKTRAWYKGAGEEFLATFPAQ